jgi:SAM-dependent methyltransferase
MTSAMTAPVSALRLMLYLARLGWWRPTAGLKFRLAYDRARRKGKVYLEVGAGPNRLEGWLSTDKYPPAPLFLDVTRRFPIADNSVSCVFGEHFIENLLPRNACLTFLKETCRVLKPGGVLRISTPDIEALARAYVSRSAEVLQLNERNKLRGYCYSDYPVDIFNKHFLEDGIKVCHYDFAALKALLLIAGFREIIRSKVGESEHPELQGIERHDVGSIADEFTCVVEATK